MLREREGQSIRIKKKNQFSTNGSKKPFKKYCLCYIPETTMKIPFLSDQNGTKIYDATNSCRRNRYTLNRNRFNCRTSVSAWWTLRLTMFRVFRFANISFPNFPFIYLFSYNPKLFLNISFKSSRNVDCSNTFTSGPRRQTSATTHNTKCDECQR
jgi:hypothetical protein